MTGKFVRWTPVAPDSTVYSELEKLYARVLELGAGQQVSLSYHLAPPFTSLVSRSATVFHFGYPDEIARRYLDPDIFENDPVPDYVVQLGHVASWRQAIADQTLSGAQKRFVAAAMELGFVDGAAIPVFGPNGRNGYATLNFGRLLEERDEAAIRPMVGEIQSCHRRICAILKRDGEDEFDLSPREIEVVYWMAHGKSNGDIGTILGISEGTVQTYIKRIFEKTGVNDRTSVVVKCLGSGKITF